MVQPCSALGAQAIVRPGARIGGMLGDGSIAHAGSSGSVAADVAAHTLEAGVVVLGASAGATGCSNLAVVQLARWLASAAGEVGEKYPVVGHRIEAGCISLPTPKYQAATR